METQRATPVTSASFDGVENWHDLDWARIQRAVRKTQLKIAQATRDGDWRRAKRLQRLLTRSFYGRCLAVRRVTENRVARRRVSMEKPGERLRPSSGPSVVWRRSVAIGPNRCGGCGYRSPANRKSARWASRRCWIGPCKRCTCWLLNLSWKAPAIPGATASARIARPPTRLVELFHLLSMKHSAQWVLEGDIKGFFDNINHDWLCRNVLTDRSVLHKWLKAGVVDRRQLMATEAGTPQGGIISPCLANATLNGLETELKRHLARKLGKTKAKETKVHVVRYADDFVVTANSKELLEQEVQPWIEQFLSVRGVALSREKTQIVHIHQGFDFLGWNFRKYVPKSPRKDAKLLIKPSKKNVSTFYRKVREIIKSSGALTQEALIGQLNPVLKGWAQYHSPVVAKQTFSTLDHLVFWRLWRWAKRRHPKKSADWIRKRYFRSIGGRNWVFAYPYMNGKGGKQFRQLYSLAGTVIVRHKRLSGEYQPYDAEHELKWEALRVQRMQHTLRYRGQILSLFRRQQGKCALCGQAISKETGWHDHHVIRRVDGGPDTLRNRVLLHPNCHALVRSRQTKVTLRHSDLEC